MKGYNHITKIREYLDYVERHLINVENAWKIFKVKCSDLHPITDDFLYHQIDQMIFEHDVSKMSKDEFIPYQEQFYPVGKAPPKNSKTFELAWEHHKKHNPHHWENWTKRKDRFPNEKVCHCVCMIVDWMAMGMEFKDTAEEYYLKNKGTIELPDWADEFLIKGVFPRLRNK